MSLRSEKHLDSTDEGATPRQQQRQVENRDYADNTENKDNASNADSQVRSIRTHTSKSSSTSSSTSSAALKARAKAVAARAQLAYSEKEATMMKQKSELEANLHVLSCQKAVAAAEAEAAVYEEEEESFTKSEVRHSIVGQPANPMQRTAEFVQSHPDSYYERFLSKMDPLASHKAAREQCEMAMNTEIDERNFYSEKKPDIKVEQQTQEREERSPPKLYPYDTLPTPAETQGKQDITCYLRRREMLSTGLLQFDDLPENYWAWKASFQNAIKDLRLTAQEEIDLMIKWLGNESRQQAKRIRSVHVFNPTAALHLLWERLEECYGSPEVMENALLKKIEQFPKLNNRDNTKLRELGDILQEIECAKDGGYLPGLSYLDTSRGVNPIVDKLPYGLQDKWIATGAKYKEEHKVVFPPFSVFSKFVRQQAKIRNDPSFVITSPINTSFKKEKSFKSDNRRVVSVHKTDIPTDTSTAQKCFSKPAESPDKLCPLHKKPHPLTKCKTFRAKPIDERKSFLKDNRICFKCCSSTQHLAKDCNMQIRCMECGSERHLTALHPGPLPAPEESSEVEKGDGGETHEDVSVSVVSKCTEVCGDANSTLSCSKISPVIVYPKGERDQAVKLYAVLDEQSNKSLVKSQFFELFNIETRSDTYKLRTCSGLSDNVGRTASNFMIESVDGRVKLPLPNLIECDMIPDDRREIPSSQVAMQYPHLQRIANKIPPVEEKVPILLLLGRDIIQLHKVRERINGPRSTPYAQRLDLGWVIVGETCLGKTHKPPNVNVLKTNVLQNGRASYFSPCPNTFQIKESNGFSSQSNTKPTSQNERKNTNTDQLGQTVFERTKDDDKPALSIEDKYFLDIMEKEVYQNEDNSWVAPLPFQSPRPKLPSNKEQALKRLQSLRKTLDRNPEMKKQYVEFIQNMLDNDHAEIAPILDSNKEHWYLPSFGVYHPQKPNQLRVVFDSSAEFEGQSLNKVLLSGPDLNNTLLGVLMRFRKESVAFSADVQQMFYCFQVREDHRDYLRFLWYENNDMSKSVCDYRMKVHVFGNSPSPAVAIYCMRRAAVEGEEEHGLDAKQFVMRHFYVDDGLASTASSEEAVEILTNAQNMLAQSNLKLHKIASNDSKVVEAFPVAERAKDLKDLDLEFDNIPLQRSLGVLWDLENDCFTFHVNTDQKPYTRRGVLATINSLYDPLGFVSPITMQGKALLRELSAEQKDWDEPLPIEREEEWNKWRTSLKHLEQLQIPRCYLPFSQTTAVRKELCIFSDASTMAIGAVAYLRALNTEGQWHTGFIMGKSKVAPRPAHTIPRLELCAAVLAVEMYELITDEIDIEVDIVRFFTDSKIVLGYIHNNTKRFYTYVANRVNRIRKTTHPAQWFYINTDDNPADKATRSIAAPALTYTNWFSGPSFLTQPSTDTSHCDTFALIEPDADAEIKPEIKTFVTQASVTQFESRRFERFSHWMRLCHTVASLKRVTASFKKTNSESKGWKCFSVTNTPNELEKAAKFIIHTVQTETFKEEYRCIKANKPLPNLSCLKKLNPIIDEDGLLRIGGRLAPANLTKEEKHPLIIPNAHHVAVLLIRYYHEKVAHQGRHLSEGALRAAGFWIKGSKRLVSSVIHKCVLCRKLRGQLQTQKMADLPIDRLTPMPPFTSVGLDVFGPWSVITRRTRGGNADSKRWAVLFTCMSTRAVHIELIESMSTSSFINALRRFFSIRGPAQILRSDRGTNFVGACNELKIDHKDTELTSYLQEKGCTWLFNSPHSSHMGGAWERLIGVARRILDGILLKATHVQLTHEVLSTFMAEVMAIMNARPLVPVSTDPDKPNLLTPATLLTQKTNTLTAPTGNFAPPDLYAKQWKQVQCMADTFWKQWRSEYLSSLQQRRKWTDDKPNIKTGDIVLLKDVLAHRNDWCMGRVVKTFESKDNKVRKAEVKTVKDGNVKLFMKPISDLVLLLPVEK
ncbi:thymocyte nuclear protein 1 isoform X1 [Corythoichthys intestinalis]|uniref:thymocyte nuclear protein 1 isoform X1 n=1 Tax=Corythoichthys intestinalis TaxID=161448 RepID=UPI0025A5286E|nr:thymocyte nuclear protein 1 isoform X1 [Corythoichthys intestinalis]